MGAFSILRHKLIQGPKAAAGSDERKAKRLINRASLSIPKMPEAKIKAALIRLHVGIKNSDGPGISSTLIELEALRAAHREELHPQLDHFLAGRSYAKALAYLGGGNELSAKPASPPGGCGGRA